MRTRLSDRRPAEISAFTWRGQRFFVRLGFETEDSAEASAIFIDGEADGLRQGSDLEQIRNEECALLSRLLESGQRLDALLRALDPGPPEKALSITGVGVAPRTLLVTAMIAAVAVERRRALDLQAKRAGAYRGEDETGRE